MRSELFAAGILVCALAAPALGATITGSGGAIPGTGSGGGGDWNGGNPTALPDAPFESTVILSDAVASVQSITFTGLVHQFVGDLQAVLYSPDGTGHNIFVRPGVGFNNSVFGSAMQFDGSYTFFESGAASDLPTLSGGGGGSLASGDYNQTFGGSPTAMGTWEDGAQGIHNTPLSQISGSAGQWTLRIFDWTGGDVGTLGGWSMSYVLAVPGPGAAAMLGLAGLLVRTRRRA